MQRLTKEHKLQILQSTLFFFCMFAITGGVFSKDLFTP